MYALVTVAFVGLLRLAETTTALRLRWLLCALVVGAASYQATWLARDVVTGDGSAAMLVVPPRYPPLRVPPSTLAARFDANGRLAADFSQVYFPACADEPIALAYQRASLDPWGRNSRFAPLVHAVCRWTGCALPYGWASLAHLALQVALLGYGVVRAWRLLALPRETLPTMLAVGVGCLFLAPVGLAFLERGQWSVYVGLAYLWLVLGILLDRPRYVVAAAAFAFLKWTSLPLSCAVLGAHALSGRSFEDCRQRARPALVFAVTFALLFLCMPEAGAAFFEGLQRQELGSRSNGVSLVHFLPRPVAKLLPPMLALLGALALRDRARTDPALVPFAAGAAILLLSYPTVAHDYSFPSILGFLPLVAYWARAGALPERLGVLASTTFALFLLLASWSSEVFGDPPAIVGAYVVAAATLVLLAFARVNAPRPAG